MTRKLTQLEKWALEYGRDPEFVAMGLANQVIEDALGFLILRGKKPSDLAGILGVSPKVARRLLDTRSSMTLLDVAKIAVALKVKANVTLRSERDEGAK